MTTWPTGRLAPRSTGGQGVLLLVVTAFAVLRLAEAAGVLSAPLAAWGDDLLCLPLVLTAALVVHRLAGRSAGWTLPWSHGLAVFALYSVLFEVVLPRLTAAAVADPLDVAAYAAGGVLFQFALNVPGGLPRPARTCGPD